LSKEVGVGGGRGGDLGEDAALLAWALSNAFKQHAHPTSLLSDVADLRRYHQDSPEEPWIKLHAVLLQGHHSHLYTCNQLITVAKLNSMTLQHTACNLDVLFAAAPLTSPHQAAPKSHIEPKLQNCSSPKVLFMVSSASAGP